LLRLKQKASAERSFAASYKLSLSEAKSDSTKRDSCCCPNKESPDNISTISSLLLMGQGWQRRVMRVPFDISSPRTRG
jgi:hypothetical protein